MANSPWSRPLFNLNLAALRRLRRAYREPLDSLLRMRLLTTATLFSGLGRLQSMLFEERLRQVLVQRPIFIVGHWRSGSTLLHQLMALDERFAAPTTADCFNPHTFLLTAARQISNRSSVLRPMGDIDVTSSSPQEEEFALLCLGAPSAYAGFVFPRAIKTLPDLCDTPRWSREGQLRWSRLLEQFLKGVLFARGVDRHLVVKSPTNSFRVEQLRRLFPDAGFVRLRRDPEQVFSSTMRMWQTMSDRYAIGARLPISSLKEKVMQTEQLMERRFDEIADAIPSRSWATIDFEDLTMDASSTLSAICEQLGFAQPSASTRKRVESYLEHNRRTRASYPYH